MFTAIFTGLIIIVLYFSLRQGIEKGSSYFRFSDVNFVFTAPITPSRVLLYGFIKHAGTSLLIVLFTIFQIPNIKNNFMLQSYGVWMILLTVLFYSLLYPILGMILYIYASERKTRRIMAKHVLDALMVLFALGFAAQLVKKGSLIEAVTDYLGSGFFTWIPFVGQLRGIASAAVDGIGSVFYVSIFILMGIIAAFVVILYRTNMDYYEDVLVATEHSEQRIKAKREGRGTRMQKVRKVKGSFTLTGAAAIFQKNLLEYRKTSLFLFFDKATIIIVIAGIGFKYIMPNGGGSIFLTLFFSIYMLFFFVIQGKWPMEMDKPYIFLIPEPNGRKLLFATMTENLKNMLDGVLLFIIAYFVYDTSPLVIVLCIISYTLYGAVYIYGDIVSRRLFGSIHSKAMHIFIKLFVSVFVIAPGIILMIISTVAFRNEVVSVLAVTMWNVIAAAGLFFAAKGIFKDIETN